MPVIATFVDNVPARWRSTSPVCELTELICVSIDTPAGVQRFVFALASAEQLGQSLARAIEDHRSGTNSQAPSSSGKPTSSVSMPGTEKV